MRLSIKFPTSPRSAVEATVDLFFRARHDPSIQPSAWDDLVAKFDEQKHAQLEDATSVEKAEEREKEEERREKEEERREKEDERREKEEARAMSDKEGK
ncbi:hypothetical protein J4E86_003741 [Alternaria arbusti]|uniref:uncharacterized protein n=1 Tax=Alternaria arbusti TaxID=232088 RepID=UPI00221F9002|nr:uncharacterized protein J4E86_003741 [Alternaria arbusti]KAI4958145.1 hypothetical protein J4E86_003741 [Alternaria arbusti]